MKLPFVYEVKTIHIPSENITETGRVVKVFALTKWRAYCKVLMICSVDEVVSEIDSLWGHLLSSGVYQPATERKCF